MTLLERVIAAAADELKADVTADTGINDVPAWDSLGHVSLLLQMEQAFGVPFDVDAMMTIQTIQDIVDYLELHNVGA
jgi:acyl carrier protein